MPDASSEPIGPSPRPRGASRLAQLIARLRAFGRRHRALIAVVGSLATAAVLVFLLAGRRQEFADAISATPVSVLAATVLLQVIGLLARSEAWHLTIEAAGGTVERRVLYRASSMQVVGSVIALAALAQLPVGPSVGAAASVLILGRDGGCGGGRRGSDDRDGHDWRAVLRGVGRRRPALVPDQPGPFAACSCPRSAVPLRRAPRPSDRWRSRR